MKYIIEIHHGIGDVIQMTGIIETIYKNDSRADIGVIVYSKNRAELFNNDDRINNVYYINLVDMSKSELFKTVLSIRRYKYDYTVFAPISNEKATRYLAFGIGAKISCGEQLCDRKICGNTYISVPKEDVHLVERNNNVLLRTSLVDKVENPKLSGYSANRGYQIIARSVGV